MDIQFLSNCYPSLEKNLLHEIEAHSTIKNFSSGEYIVRQGQFVRFLPIVVEGTVKVFSNEDTIQFLLYFIESGDSCIYSFAHAFNDQAAEFSATAESDSQLLLLPMERVRAWMKRFPSFSGLILGNYQKHYTDLLNTTKQIICHNLDGRLLSYLDTRAKLEGSNLLAISHQAIADDLGTSREVITRLLKKLSLEEKVKQVGRKIKLL